MHTILKITLPSKQRGFTNIMIVHSPPPCVFSILLFDLSWFVSLEVSVTCISLFLLQVYDTYDFFSVHREFATYVGGRLFIYLNVFFLGSINIKKILRVLDWGEREGGCMLYVMLFFSLSNPLLH